MEQIDILIIGAGVVGLAAQKERFSSGDANIRRARELFLHYIANDQKAGSYNKTRS